MPQADKKTHTDGRILFCVLLSLISLALVVGAGVLFAYARVSKPYVEDGEGGPTETLERFFSALDEEQWDSAWSLLANCASLGLEQTPEDPVSAMLWSAQQESRDFAVDAEYTMDGSVLIKRVRIRSLCFDPMTDFCAGRVRELLAEAVENARLRSDIYDESGAYRLPYVEAALEQAFAEALDEGRAEAAETEIVIPMTLTDGQWKIVADETLLSALTGGMVSSAEFSSRSDALASVELAAAFDIAVNNLRANVLEGLVPVPKIYWIAESAVVAPTPSAGGYGSGSAEDFLSACAAAGKLTDGVALFWREDRPLLRGTELQWYVDETIVTVIWKQVVNDMVITFSEVILSHPSQFRRYLSDDSFSSSVYYTPSELAQTVNSVVALSGDFCKFRRVGICVYHRQLYRFENRLDTCMVDGSGDLHFIRPGELADEAAAQSYIDENDILFSLSFGPILIEDGINVCPREVYPIGEITLGFARSALCQLGPLHYMLVTTNQEAGHDNVSSAWTLARYLHQEGVPTAYMLDGGQTATLVFRGDPVNLVQYRSQRRISDIIYFATAIPD